MVSGPSAPRSQLDALSDAIRALTTEISIERVLRRLAEISAHLVNARYAALGVPSEMGGLAQFYTYGMTERQVARMDHLPVGHGLLRELLRVTNPIRLEDLRQDPRSAGFCAAHPTMTSFLGVPIISKGVHLGSLYLCDRLNNQPFSDEDERLVTMLAGHAAVAIENARLNEQLRKLAIIEERDRIAMELHDGIIQQIFSVGIRLDITRRTQNPPDEIAEQLKNAASELNRVIEDLRMYIRDLNRGVDYAVTLGDQFREVFEGFRSVSSSRLVSDIQPGLTHLTEDKVHVLVQLTREMLSNIARHARASEGKVEWANNGHRTELTTSDKGMGFNPGRVQAGRAPENMTSGVGGPGGTLTTDSPPGHGP
ncbi:MAG: GAF domain-containing protein, partial [Anaerolineae bacterium]|nr:GAF domain-containing protein [Anaerolineae bacterium]